MRNGYQVSWETIAAKHMEKISDLAYQRNKKLYERAKEMAEAMIGLEKNDIKEVYEWAKKIIPEVAKEKKEEMLKNLFKAQIKRFRDLKISETIIQKYERMEYQIIDKAMQIDYKDNNIPFVLVIPEKYLSFYSQCQFIGVEVDPDIKKTDPALTEICIFNVNMETITRKHYSDFCAPYKGRRYLTAVEALWSIINIPRLTEPIIAAGTELEYLGGKYKLAFDKSRKERMLVCSSWGLNDGECIVPTCEA